MKKISFFVVIFSIVFGSCGGKETAAPAIDCAGATPTYLKNVKEILDNNCAFSGCHSAVSKEQGYDLSTYASSKTAVGKAALLGSINHWSGYDKMPKSGIKMSDADIKTITCWAENSAPQ